jgi:hypothetical protein
LKRQTRSSKLKFRPGDLVIGAAQEYDGIKFEPVKAGFVCATIGENVIVFVDGEFCNYPDFFLKKL